MNNIPAQEIKRCGISAVDDALRQGPVHIIKNNRPQDVVLTEEHYTDLLEAQASADRDSLQTSLDDLKAGRITRYDDVDALMRQIEQDATRGGGRVEDCPNQVSTATADVDAGHPFVTADATTGPDPRRQDARGRVVGNTQDVCGVLNIQECTIDPTLSHQIPPETVAAIMRGAGLLNQQG